MKPFKKSTIVILSVFICGMLHPLAGSGNQIDRINVSFTLSGHILLGIGYEHFFDTNHAAQFTFFPVFLPGKDLPFAFNAGYGYYTKGDPWRGKVGLNFTLLISPPDPEKRKVMPLLCLTPGVAYRVNDLNEGLSQVWLAYFLGKANRKFAPIGLEFQYNKKL